MTDFSAFDQIIGYDGTTATGGFYTHFGDFISHFIRLIIIIMLIAAVLV